MENKPIEEIEFDVVLPNTVDKLVKADKIKIKLYNNYLSYSSNYIVEQECILLKDRPDEPILREAFDKENTEHKKLKVEDEGVLGLKNLCISRETKNILGDPGEGTTLLYRILLEYPGNYINFHFTDKKIQKEVYNKLIDWQISQNNWI